MEVVRSNFFTKSNTINSVVRNTSCSRGWLRVVVQAIFGVITVASFVLIVLMAVTRGPFKRQKPCAVNNCRVNCGRAIFDSDYEQNIVSAALETGLYCDKIIVILNDVQFTNETMPLNWLSRMPPHVENLFLIGGNLRHIPPTAFLGQFAGSLRKLALESITITSWTSDTFVGLINLNELMIKDSVLLDIERNALSAVDDTIESLSVTNCEIWDPRFVTGGTSLETVRSVYLSQNDFRGLLNANSFTGLKACRVLFLNSCKITSIGPGAFDSLVNIEMLFLNDNYLTYITPGLFTTLHSIKHPRPRIHLQDNRWTCDCSQKDLLLLATSDLLLVDPTCYLPYYLYGKRFSKLEEHCDKEDGDVEVIILPRDISSNDPTSVASGSCYHGTTLISNSTLMIVSPASQFDCQFQQVTRFVQQLPRDWNDDNDIEDGDWLKPNFLIQNEEYLTIQVGSNVKIGYGLVWHQTTCPNEAYCVSVTPNFLRVYNVVSQTVYTFCPINLETAEVNTHNCVRYNTSLINNVTDEYELRYSVVLYVVTGIFCVLIGAIVVYGLIRTNPTLLKGSKRLLFVKHKGVDALVLPPKIPLRNSLSCEESLNYDDSKIFTVLENNKFDDYNLGRSNSIRSDKSMTPTYVSAMQPTEAQLAEWRIRNHFGKINSIISLNSDVSKYSLTCEGFTENSSNIYYESLK